MTPTFDVSMATGATSESHAPPTGNARIDIPLSVDRRRSRLSVGDAATGRAHVLHCSYYNNYLLRTIWKDAAAFADSERLLLGAAAEQAYFS